jgi:small nuclear ribonucleoprotein B and B'
MLCCIIILECCAFQTSGKGSKLLRYVEHRIRVTLTDSRTMVGTFLAFDKYLNLVLCDTEEFRTLRSKGDRTAVVEERQEKRSLGLIILRGETVVSIAVEGPPPSEKRPRLTPGGPGVANNVGRGTAMPSSAFGVPPPGQLPPMGLGSAPVHGVGVAVGTGMMGRGMPPPGMGRGMPPPPP